MRMESGNESENGNRGIYIYRLSERGEKRKEGERLAGRLLTNRRRSKISISSIFILTL